MAKIKINYDLFEEENETIYQFFEQKMEIEKNQEYIDIFWKYFKMANIEYSIEPTEFEIELLEDMFNQTFDYDDGYGVKFCNEPLFVKDLMKYIKENN